MKRRKQAGYNERLFKSGPRRFFHLARFRWFAAEMRKRGLPGEAVLELGCFDGKLIRFLPRRPRVYKGFDAGWEGGLEAAAETWKDVAGVSFQKAATPEEMTLSPGERFDTAISMETLEHVPPKLVDPYLRKIAEHLDGYFFVTVPNEKGPLFMLKWIFKVLLRIDPEPYNLREWVWAGLGVTSKVSRREHKGFNYADLIQEMERHFEVISVKGHPFSRLLPAFLCLNICIVAKSRRPG